jgi:AcrR family transcriptional regulator
MTTIEARGGGPRERTRRLLMQAARELLQSGKPLTVQALAEHAGVSRATAYRYFSSNDAVALHATLPIEHPLSDPTWSNQSTSDPTGDVVARVRKLVRVMGVWAFDHETELRTVFALSLQPDAKERGFARRPGLGRYDWIATVLKELPDTVDDAARDRLAAALLPLFGADAVVWLTDVAGLEREAGIDLLAWMAGTLVEATLSGTLPQTTP